MKRLDRIDRYSDVTGLYREFSVTVIIPEDKGSTYQTQVMAVTAVAILSRWCPEINIVFNDVKSDLVPGPQRMLSDIFLDFARGNSAT